MSEELRSKFYMIHQQRFNIFSFFLEKKRIEIKYGWKFKSGIFNYGNNLLLNN
jgi:hypothetical protein